MNETPSTTHSSESRTVTVAVVVFFACLILLVIGGLVESVALIGVCALGVLGGIAGVWRRDPAGVLSIHLPVAAAISLVTGGLYLDSGLLWFAGFLLMLIYGVWRFTRTFGHSVTGEARDR